MSYLPTWCWLSGDITLAIACSSKYVAANEMGVDVREVFISLNPSTGQRANELPGVVLTRDMEEGPYFYDYHSRRSQR